MKLLTSAVPLVFVVAAVVLLAATGNMFSASPWVIAAQVGAVGLNVWARRSFAAGTFRVSAAPGGSAIIRRGPYRVVRHPMYTAVLVFVWAGVVSHVSGLTLAVGAAVTAVVVARVVAEERILRAELSGYREYARTTKALVPFLF